jgi:hypothetical protein
MPNRARSHKVVVERQYEARSSESFNRIAYAMELLQLLNPPLKVVVFGNSRRVFVERGRGLGAEGPWALLGVPPHATRESIVRVLAELSGLERAPFLIDLLSAQAPPALG